MSYQNGFLRWKVDYDKRILGGMVKISKISHKKTHFCVF